MGQKRVYWGQLRPRLKRRDYSIPKIFGAPTHRRRKGEGVCRGSDTPTIYVGDIDMYIPPREI